jgi:cell division protein FtsQ
VVGYARISDRRWNLLLGGDVIVELPEEGWAKQLDVLEHLIVDKGVLERDISEIDLRVPDNFFFVLRNGQKQQLTRGNAA